MAVMRLYVIYDKIAEESGPVFQAPNDGVAKRNYRGLLQQVAKVDQNEYRLVLVGTIETGTSQVTALDPEVIIIEDSQLEFKEVV